MKCIIFDKCYHKLNKKWQKLMCNKWSTYFIKEQNLINIKHFGSFFPICSVFKVNPLDDLQICLTIQCCKDRFCFFNYIRLFNNILLFDNYMINPHLTI